MNIFGIGLPEMAVIMVLALLVFGPKKLPEIGRSVGKAIRGFQEASKEFENEFRKEADRLEQVATAPIEARLETPAPKALNASAPEATGEQPPAEQIAEIVEDAPAPSPSSQG